MHKQLPPRGAPQPGRRDFGAHQRTNRWRIFRQRNKRYCLRWLGAGKVREALGELA